MFSACLAGFVSGLVLTGVQTFDILPVLFEAETYEQDAGPEPSMRTTAGRHTAANGHAAGDGHRLGWTAVANVGFGIGLGLLLCAVYALRSPGTWAHGMLWGVGGYATFFLAPAAGLPPEIPGTVTEALGARQLWWLLAVTFTGVGLSLLFLGPGWIVKVLGLILIPIPHLMGAPHTGSYSGLAPEILADRFYAATLVVNAIFWLVLGTTSAFFFRRFTRQAGSEG